MTNADTAPQPDVVLGKAVIRASEQLGLEAEEISLVIDLPVKTIARLKVEPSLDPQSVHGDLALKLIRVARALYALLGGSKKNTAFWMRSENRGTGGIPAEQIKTPLGLAEVLRYVDGMRGKA